MFRLVIRKMLLDKEYLEKERKSYPVFAVFVEKYLEEKYPGWYEHLSESACPICHVLIQDAKQLYYHLTNRSRCAYAFYEIIDEIMNEYDKFYTHVCKKQYTHNKKQLTEWLEKYGLRKTVELCRESA
jgi:uncharacterized membrane-anchored protein YhcB (DUF1043 family)